MNTELTAELEELQDQARATVQLSQADRMTMQGHLREKLRLGRQRLRETWGIKPESEPDDDMQILARDISIYPEQKETTTTTTTATQTPAQPLTPQKAGWPAWVAALIAMSVPSSLGVLMAPWIIEAFLGKPDPPAVTQPSAEYAPILIPGKPGGAN